METCDVLYCENGKEILCTVEQANKRLGNYEVFFPEDQFLENRRKWTIKNTQTGETLPWTFFSNFIQIGEIYITAYIQGCMGQYDLAKMNLKKIQGIEIPVEEDVQMAS